MGVATVTKPGDRALGEGLYVGTNSTHLHGVLPIVQLVREKVNASGMSLRVFAADRRIAYSTVRRYYDPKLGPLSQPPRKETLRDLALALDVPLREVEQAALESLSYRAAPPALDPGATKPDVIDVSALSPHNRRLLEALADALKEKSHGQPAATKTEDPDVVRRGLHAELAAAPGEDDNTDVTKPSQTPKRRITDLR